MIRKWLLFTMVVFLLSGCWDQRSLKNVRLPTILGFDIEKSGKTVEIAVIRVPIGTSQGIEGTENEQITVKGDDLVDCQMQIDQVASEKTSYSQVQLLLLGEEYAKKNIGNFLDSYFSLAKSSYVAQLAIISGKTEDVFKKRQKEDPLLDEYLAQLIKTGIKLTMIPNTTTKLAHMRINDEGSDIIIPYVKVGKSKKLCEISGVALFDEQRFSGETLEASQTELLLAYMGSFGKKLWKAEQKNLKDFPFVINKVKKSQEIKQDKAGMVVVDFHLNFMVTINEQTGNKLDSLKKYEYISKNLSKYYTKKSNTLFTQLRNANCDALGIGRDLIAHRPEIWKEITCSGDGYYQKVKIRPHVKVEITNTNMAR